VLYLGVALARVGTAGSGGFTSSGERQWQSAMVSVIRPGNGSIELVEGWDRCGAKLGSSGCERFERGRRGVAGPTPAAGSAHSARHELEEGEEGEGKTMLGATSG